jgi:hypothetical protein
MILVALGASAVGFYCGRNLFSSASQSAAVSVSANSTPVKLKPEPAVPTSEAIVQRSTQSAAVTWDDRWKDLMTQSRTRLRDNQILAAIEDLATRDAKRALSLALAEVNLRLRLDMLRAALRSWAKSNPDAAGDWVLSHQSIIDKSDAATAVITGVIQDPDAAIRLFSHLSETDPGSTREFGNSLIAALSNNGEFSRAAEFAAQGTAQYRTDWLTAAFGSWSEYQPQTAAAEAMKLQDPDSRQSAVHAALTGWAQGDPKGLAEYAISMPDGQDKSFALTESLPSWAVNEPAAAAEWINQRPSSPELDQGIATVALSLDNKPEVAVTWAESIANPQLRSSTLATLVRQWIESDPAAAQQYANTSTNIIGEDRFDLLTGFGGGN